MHIPDGYLSPQTYVVLDAAIIPIWVIAATKVKTHAQDQADPPDGAGGGVRLRHHDVQRAGHRRVDRPRRRRDADRHHPRDPGRPASPYPIALVIQALVFGDGGITAIGANCINMAVVLPFVGYYLYRLIAGDAPSTSRRVISSGVAAYVAIVAAAIVAGFEFGIQPYLAHTASGQALYAPYPLGVAVPAMALEHLLFFGWVEAFVTMGVVGGAREVGPRSSRDEAGRQAAALAMGGHRRAHPSDADRGARAGHRLGRVGR